MTTPPPPARPRFSRLGRGLLIAACSLPVLAAVGACLLVHYWPFDQKDIVETLQDVVPGTKVTVTRFRGTYFLHPGCTAEGIVFVRPNSGPNTPPLVTVQKLVIRANYSDLLLRPGHISRIIINGLHIQVPPNGSGTDGENASMATASAKRMVVGEIVSNGTVLEIGRQDDSPLRFEIHNLRLNTVGLNQVMSYAVRLQNPLPPGEVQADGKLGPWNSHDIGQIPVSGSYKFGNADLSVFPGIAGILSSAGRFQGKLAQIEVAAETAIPEFSLTSKRRPVQVKSHFEVTVDGTNGDIRISKMNVQLQNTPIRVQGSILGKSPAPGKLISLDFFATGGRVQDVLQPFVKAAVPPMSGSMNFRAHVNYPSAEHPFLKAVSLVGDFTISNGRFTKKDTQEGIDSLSERAQGLKDASVKPEMVDPSLTSHVVLSRGVARFSELVFEVPGAHANMDGTYNIINDKVDFRGNLKTDVEFSQSTSGIKSVLLKPLNTFFKRKHHKGASIPVEMTGTYSEPHIGIDLALKRF